MKAYAIKLTSPSFEFIREMKIVKNLRNCSINFLKQIFVDANNCYFFDLKIKSWRN